jgi:molybdopterin converting factor small subunit
MRSLADDHEMVRAEGANVRALIDDLDRRYPGVRERLCRDDELRTGLTVVVNGSVSALGLLQPVEEDAEIHFLPALGGG